jgi:hypothetical protein
VRLVGRDGVEQPHQLGGVAARDAVVVRSERGQLELAHSADQPAHQQCALGVGQEDPSLAQDEALKQRELVRRERRRLAPRPEGVHAAIRSACVTRK